MIPDRFKVIVVFDGSDTVIDSVLYNGILAGDNIIQSVENYFVMPEVESITINVELDAGKNNKYGDDWEKTWNDQNWAESDSLDNIFSKTIYLETGLQAPTNPEMFIDGENGTIEIQWDGRRNASYKVYSSLNPFNDFEEDESGAFTGTTWIAPLPDENRFYYVVETDERTKSKIIPFKRGKINRRKK